MVTSERKLLAERLRVWLLEFADLPVKGGAFSLDGLNPEGRSMSLQMNAGQEVKAYLDGSRLMLQPFTIFYRAGSTENNPDKSAMIGVLNALGDWMEEADPPYLGPEFKVSKVSQVQLANISDQADRSIAYMATYALEYEVE